MLETLLNSPLIWILSIGLLTRSFIRFNQKGLMTEKKYYHWCHTELDRLVELLKK